MMRKVIFIIFMMFCVINSGCVNYRNNIDHQNKINKIQCPIAEEIERAYREQEKNR